MAGCTQNPGTDNPATPEPAPEPATLTVLNYTDTTSASFDDEVSTMWTAFTKANPHITIVREDLSEEAFHNKVESYYYADTLPDVMYAWPSGRSATLHIEKKLKDLRPLLVKDGLASSYFAISLADQAGGFLGELPSGVTQTHVLYVNKAVLADCGLTQATTYEEMKSQVATLKAKGYQTLLMANAETWVMQSCFFSDIAGRFCGTGWTDKIFAETLKFTDTDFVNALSFVKTLYDDGVLSADTLETNYGEVATQFATNKGAYYIDGDWRVGAYITDPSTGVALISPAKQQTDIAMTVFPVITGTKHNNSSSLIVGTGWGMNASIPAGSAKEKAAWKLIKWLQSKEIQSWRVQTGGSPVPSRTDINVGSLTLEPMQKMIAGLPAQYTNVTEVFDGVFASAIWEELNSGLQQIGLGTKTPQEVATAMQSAFDTWKAAQK